MNDNAKPSRNQGLPSDLLEWRVKKPSDQDGIVVGCDGSHEWLLPWWWVHYRSHNNFPVTFFDFGNMSEQAQAWCRDKGQLVVLDLPMEAFLTGKPGVSSASAADWEGDKGSDVWVARPHWFKKPFVCLHSPYKRTLWIDMDCQVRKSVAGLFDFCDNPLGVSLALEPKEVNDFYIQLGRIHQDEIEYNSGVVAFKHGAPLIVDWAQACVENNANLRGDQEVITRVLYEKKIKLFSLLPEHNARWHLGVAEDTVIIHWLGSGKQKIHLQMEAFKKVGLMDLSFDLQ